jgi:HRAS-like suppressor 3
MENQVPIGAHLTTPRGLFAHHGIYVGSGRVVNYSGLFRRPRHRVVEELSLSQFTKGFAFRVISGRAARFTGEDAVARARSRLGERRYRLWTNNCEHFCEWCLSGVSQSHQVEAWKRRFGNTCNVFGLSHAARLSSRISSEILGKPVEIAH